MSIPDATLRSPIHCIVEDGFPQHARDRLTMRDVNVLSYTRLAALS
jgi:hypothetical protein